MFSSLLFLFIASFLCWQNSSGFRPILSSPRCRTGLICLSSEDHAAAALPADDKDDEPIISVGISSAVTAAASERADSIVEKDDDDVFGDFDFTLDESAVSESFEQTVKQLLDERPKSALPEISPVEKFQMMYKDIKAMKNSSSTETTKLDSAAMLKLLFPEPPVKDPFDERKVMIKLRNMLAKEDFEGLFKDPIIGDWL